MKRTVSKSKLTLWLQVARVRFGKTWARAHKESLSQLISDYLYRLEQIETEPARLTPLVAKLAGVIKGGTITSEEYRTHLRKKYLDA